MASKLCEICGVRPASLRVRVSQNGRERTLDICEADYRRLQSQQRRTSPFESLFRGSLMEDFFGDSKFGGDDGFEDARPPAP